MKLKPKIKKLADHIGCFSKPNFIIIGAQKAGTTGLHAILQQHSKITSAFTKELHYFDNDILYGKKNLSDYHCQFPKPKDVPKNNLLFEGSPLYLYHPKVAERLYNYNAQLKLIVLLRNPVERAVSAWTMYHYHFKNGKHNNLYDPRSFNDAINEELLKIDETNFYNNPLAYIKRGIYHYQLENYYKYFTKKQILIIESNELKQNFDLTINKLFDFLDIPHEKIKLLESNKSQVKVTELTEEKERLKSFYQPHNEKLYKLINKNYNW